MYKIQFLFVMLLWGLGVTYAQQSGQRRSSSTQRRAKTTALSKLLNNLTNTIQSRQPTVFTDHQLASQVDLSKKPAFDTSTGGQQASLSSPTPCQTPFR